MYYIQSEVKTELVIDKSRFIGQLYIVHSVEEAQATLERVRLIQREANHNCYAYIIRDGKEVKSSDDKEPAKTAGVPILEVLKHHQLTDVLCVVTRYFGGIKLGAGGLIRAYTNAAAEAVKLTNQYSLVKKPMVKMHLPYGLFDTFVYQTKDTVTIVDKTFGEDIELDLILNELTVDTLRSTYHQTKVIDLGVVDVQVPKID
ncbi:IMPACT family protein [Paracholeplasma manati]|uniref:YigZ family protein n=1 Tax=Paracholeplasma manati TaxID=591373 RepID=A0ABT2Y4N6_9MOLU|nr:YigZ family protein [Paracholeplasma manati]MCV2231700.1 YigZ family protein [Paracholeplasma manati]MDG0888556.1 YigZ family protein [Paracholeplasma manati]